MEYGFTVPLLREHSLSTFTASTVSLLSPDERERLRIVVDNAGRRSGQAQDLVQPITSLSKLVCSDHVLHVCTERLTPKKTVVVGIIKTGKKKLFIYNDSPVLHEIEPVCVLDFYVHESFQRKGYGKKLFEHVLRHEKTRPENLAYDRPSVKFLSFLSRHYKLSNYIPQRNNFVVFRRYFSSPVGKKAASPAACKAASKSQADMWTPISQRPLTAKRKMYRRDREAAAPADLNHNQSQSKAQVFHRKENFVNFKDRQGSHSLAYEESRGKTIDSMRGDRRYPVAGLASKPQENGAFPFARERCSPAKFGRRSGNSPKSEQHKFNVLPSNTFHNFSMPSKQSRSNQSRTRFKHMAGQGAASCLVW
ncbi:alpha-tubulin N-acetyltransferase [Chloropicon primus]|nr:alpha-tubulin N-acetyltransferase [Chloropicon primus]